MISDDIFADARTVDILDTAQCLLGATLKRKGPHYVGACPAGCAKEDGFIVTPGKRIFLCRPSGAAGDVIALVQHVLRVGIPDALQFLTGKGDDFQTSRRGEVSISENRRPKGVHSMDATDDRSIHLWRQRQPIVEDTPPWHYLRRARGYLGPIPATLGYLPPRGEYPPSLIAAFGLADEPEPGLLAIHGATRIRAVHIIRLLPDGSDRTRTGNGDKITVGREAMGSPIVLSPANDGLGLAICEGVEDGLAIFAATGLGVWAAGGAGRMPALAGTVPSYIGCITVVGDRGQSGERYAGELTSRLKAGGFETRLTFLSSTMAAA